MKRILLFFALFIAIPSFAQIEEEIMQSSKSAKIAQGRNYLVEKFVERDFDKVKEIKDYLLSLEDDDYVAITIADNGQGITEDRLKVVLNNINNRSESEKTTYGLYNVNERIRLDFGEEYGINIDSEYGKGTKVSIKLPLSE